MKLCNRECVAININWSKTKSNIRFFSVYAITKIVCLFQPPTHTPSMMMMFKWVKDLEKCWFMFKAICLFKNFSMIHCLHQITHNVHLTSSQTARDDCEHSHNNIQSFSYVWLATRAQSSFLFAQRWCVVNIEQADVRVNWRLAVMNTFEMMFGAWLFEDI